MTLPYAQPLAIPYPLACEDSQSEALSYALRQQSPCGRLVSMVQDLGRADWLVARPGQRMGLTDLLGAAQAAQAFGVVVDTNDEVAARAWIVAQQSRLALMALPQLAQRAGIVAAVFYGRPSERLSVTGITGTNGKTTVARALARSLAWRGRAAVAVGTLGVHRFDRTGDQIVEQPLAEAGLTSLDAVSLQRRLAECLAAGVQEVVLEASSIGLLQGRLAGCRFKDVALTSFSQDHLDVHKTMDNYARAKSLLFAAPGVEGSVRARPIPGQLALPPSLAEGAAILWVTVAIGKEAWASAVAAGGGACGGRRQCATAPAAPPGRLRPPPRRARARARSAPGSRCGLRRGAPCGSPGARLPVARTSPPPPRRATTPLRRAAPARRSHGERTDHR